MITIDLTKQEHEMLLKFTGALFLASLDVERDASALKNLYYKLMACAGD